jgi:hypothetical protein
MKKPGRSVLGREIATCCKAPLTGFYRDGCCNTGPEDVGSHTVCARMTREFLEYSRQRGNDLSTPSPQSGFPGLAPGDKWCLCAARWKEALDAGVAPPVFLSGTHEEALHFVTFDELKKHALDLN